MAFLPAAFDASSIAPPEKREFDLIPAGKYRAHITDSDMRPTRDGMGQYLQLTFEILDGEHASRKLWNNLNLVNSNTQTVEYATKDLAAICHAVGVLQLSDSEDLHFKPMVIAVKVRPGSNGYADKNEIKGFYADAGAPPAPTVARPAARPAAPPVMEGFKAVPAINKAPWKK